MASIILPSRWTKQPQGVVEVDPAPLGFVRPRDVFAFNEGRLSDVDGRYPLSVTGTPTIGVAGSDKSAVFASGSSSYSTTGNIAAVSGKASILVRVRPRTTAYIFVAGVDSFRIWTQAGTNWGTHNGNNLPSGEALPLNVWTTLLVATTATANTAYFYRDGRYVGSTAGTGVPDISAARFSLNDYRPAYGQGGACDISLAAIWDSLLPDSFAKEITRNPWQIFKPKKQVIYSFSSGITVQTLFAVTYPAGTGTPSNAQIVAGQDSTGAAASWAGNAVWTGSGQYLDASGLDPATEYDSAAVIYDGTTYSNVVEVSGTWTTLSLRYGRPTADLSAGAWTPSIGSDLYAMLDEETASDAPDYITTSTAYDPCELALSAVTDPATSSGQVITIRAKSSAGSTLVATLKQPGGISGGLFLPRRWTKQPQGAVEVDWGNPLTKSLAAAIVYAGGKHIELITKQTFAGTSTPTTRPMRSVGTPQGGIGFYTTGQTLARPTPADSIIGNWTVFAETIPTGDTAIANYTIDLVLCSGDEGNMYGFGLGTDQFYYPNNVCVVQNATSGVTGVSSYIGTGVDQYTHRVCATYNGTQFSFYSGGKLISSSAYTTNPVANSGRRLNLARRPVYGTTTQNCIGVVLVFSRALSDAEIAPISQNPWQIFKPKKQVIYSFGTPSTIATRTFSSLSSSFADYQINLTPTECDSITDYNNLSIVLEAQ
jgi:hypothetical protein